MDINNSKILSWLGDLVADIRAEPSKSAEDHLIKLASTEDIPDAAVERIGCLLNTLRTVSFLDKSQEKGANFSLLNVAQLMDKLKGDKSASVKTPEAPVNFTEVKPFPSLWAGNIKAVEEEKEIKSATQIRWDAYLIKEAAKSNYEQAAVIREEFRTKLTKQADDIALRIKTSSVDSGRWWTDLEQVYSDNKEVISWLKEALDKRACDIKPAKVRALSLLKADDCAEFEKLANYFNGYNAADKLCAGFLKQAKPSVGEEPPKKDNLVGGGEMGSKAPGGEIEEEGDSSGGDNQPPIEEGASSSTQHLLDLKKDVQRSRDIPDDMQGEYDETLDNIPRYRTPFIPGSKHDQKGGPHKDSPHKKTPFLPASRDYFKKLFAGAAPDPRKRQLNYNREVEAIHAGSVLQEMLHDEVLSGHDPHDVASAYNSFRSISPQLALDPNIARVTLRNMMQYQGIDPLAAKSFADAETAANKSRSPDQFKDKEPKDDKSKK